MSLYIRVCNKDFICFFFPLYISGPVSFSERARSKRFSRTHTTALHKHIVIHIIIIHTYQYYHAYTTTYARTHNSNQYYNIVKVTFWSFSPNTTKNHFLSCAQLFLTRRHFNIKTFVCSLRTDEYELTLQYSNQTENTNTSSNIC